MRDAYSLHLPLKDRASLKCLSLFLFFLLFSSLLPSPARSAEAQKVTSLQYRIGKGTDIHAEPNILWASNDILLIDFSKIFFWKKRKIFQIAQQDGDDDEFRVKFAPGGARFLSSGRDETVLGHSDTLELKSLSERIDIDSLVFSKEGARLFYLKNRAFCSYNLKKQSDLRLSDNVDEFFLSSDGYRIILEEEGKGEPSYLIMNSDNTGRSTLPPGCLFREERSGNPFIKNVSPDFRRIIVEKGRGFQLQKIDWDNTLSSPISVLEDVRGNQDAAFSPDGSKIALTGKDESGKSCMVVLSASGEIIVKFSLKPGWTYRDPLWSPDSKWVLWNYVDPAKPEETRSRCVITDSRGVSVHFIQATIALTEFYWSPRGDKLLAREPERPLQTGGYMVYDLGRKSMKPIFRDKKVRATSIPAWSPDGQLIAIIDYTTFQKREKKTRSIKSAREEIEYVYFREQIFLYDPDEDSLQLIW